MNGDVFCSIFIIKKTWYKGLGKGRCKEVSEEIRFEFFWETVVYIRW